MLNIKRRGMPVT